MESQEKDDALRYLQREENEDSIYDIYTRKVLYDTSEFGPATTLNEANKRDPVIFKPLGSYASVRLASSKARRTPHSPGRHQWSLETVRRIRAGTVAKLVASFSDHATGVIDSGHTNVLLATFRSFTDSRNLLDVILTRYDDVDNDNNMKEELSTEHKRTLKTVLYIWLKNYASDMDDPPEFYCLRRLLEFSTRVRYESLLEKVQAKLSFYLGESTKMNNRIINNPSSADEFSDTEVDDDDDEFDDDDITVDDISARSSMRKVIDNCPAAYILRNSLIRWPIEFENIKETIFAEQLTFIDAALFIQLRPYECVGGQWSSRGRARRHKSMSVSATVNQFNVVTSRVTAICLKRSLSSYRRASVITHWICIAQELRVLKNFSSLKAVLSGLQCNAVFRLTKIWELVARDKLEMYKELTEIFSEEHNYVMCRKLLMMEGSAKFADPESQNTIRGQTEGKRKNKAIYLAKRRKSMFQISNIISGTVPYLGTFLTDLTYLDTAMDNKINGLINFDKRRKEFDILAQIMLLQSSAHGYNIRLDCVFHEWFLYQRVYDERELHELSCIIEPELPKTPRSHKKKSSISSMNIFSPKRQSMSQSPSTTSLCSQQFQPGDSTSSDGCSVHSSNWFNDSFNGLKLSRSMSNVGLTIHSPVSHKDSVSAKSVPVSWNNTVDRNVRPQRDFHVVKVTLAHGVVSRVGNLYKSIIVNNQHHTTNVIKNILDKFEIEEDCKHFILFQVNNSKEVKLSDKCNVYYAMDSSATDLKFLLKRSPGTAKHHLNTKHK